MLAPLAYKPCKAFKCNLDTTSFHRGVICQSFEILQDINGITLDIILLENVVVSNVLRKSSLKTKLTYMVTYLTLEQTKNELICVWSLCI